MSEASFGDANVSALILCATLEGSPACIALTTTIENYSFLIS